MGDGFKFQSRRLGVLQNRLDVIAVLALQGINQAQAFLDIIQSAGVEFDALSIDP